MPAKGSQGAGDVQVDATLSKGLLLRPGGHGAGR